MFSPKIQLHWSVWLYKQLIFWKCTNRLFGFTSN